MTIRERELIKIIEDMINELVPYDEDCEEWLYNTFGTELTERIKNAI